MKTIWNVIVGTVDVLVAIFMVITLIGVFNAIFDSTFGGEE